MQRLSRIHSRSRLFLPAAVATFILGCRTTHVEYGSVRPLPPDPKPAKPVPSGANANAMALAVEGKPADSDGNGYPDGLSGAQISDLVRLTAICDVYSALIDRRSYKEPMTNEGALDLMATFRGHLDLDLLKAFREFVLDRG